MTLALNKESVLTTNKEILQKMVEAQNTAIGLVRDPHATAEESRALILSEGVLPADNVFSCGILSARDEE